MRNNQLPGADELEILATYPNPVVREYVATHPSSGPAILRGLVRDPAPDVRRAVAAHPALTSTDLRPLLKDAALEVVVKAVLHPMARRLPEDVAGLARSPSPKVRAAVAKVLPGDQTALLLDLAADVDDWVRHAVAQRVDCPADVTQRLAADVSPITRRVVAERADVPADTLARLLSDGDKHVSTAAAKHPALPVHLITQFYTTPGTPHELRASLLDNPRCPAEVFDLAVKTGDPLDQFVMAGNAALPAAVLDRLYTGARSLDAYHIARHPHLSLEVARDLLEYGGDDVCESVAANESEALAPLRPMLTDPRGVRDAALRGLARRDVLRSTEEATICAIGGAESLYELSRARHLSEHTMMALAKHQVVSARRGVAGRPDLPAVLREHLLTDPDEGVVTAAARFASTAWIETHVYTMPRYAAAEQLVHPMTRPSMVARIAARADSAEVFSIAQGLGQSLARIEMLRRVGEAWPTARGARVGPADASETPVVAAPSRMMPPIGG